MEMESRMSLQSLPDSDVFSPCSIDHQDVFMYEDDKRVAPCVRGESDSPTYLDISTSKSSSFPSMKQELDTDTLMSWTQKHPEHWSQNEILDWIYFVASTIEVDPTTIRGEGFQNITGPELCRMSLDDFQKRDPVNGQCFFDMFRALHKDAIFIGPLAGDFNQPDPYWDYSAHQDIKTEQQYDNQEQESTDSVTKLLDCQMLSDKEMQVMVGKYWYTVDCATLKDFDEALHEVAENYTPWPIDNGYGGSDSESMSDASEMEMANTSVYSSRIYRDKKYSTGSDVLSDDEYPLIVPTTVEKPTKARKPSTPRKKPTGEQNKQQNRGRKPGQISKGNHLWEFIRDLLKDPKFNPHLLRWEEKETGVFRFVQSEAVAQMWGRKKNNPGMTYEKLSRAMRYYYKRGILDRVDGRRLVYKFGLNSHGWK